MQKMITFDDVKKKKTENNIIQIGQKMQNTEC